MALPDDLRAAAGGLDRRYKVPRQRKETRGPVSVPLLLRAADEIERLISERDNFRELYLDTRDTFEKTHSQRGARMQIMREWLLAARSRGSCSWDGWDGFVEDHPESSDWFDEDGAPR